MNMAVSFLIGLASIALMITIHEAGHFLGARVSGIQIETFAIGWGKALKSWTRNGIEYRINIFPLGGYCKLKGAQDLIDSHERKERQMTRFSEGSLFAAHPARKILTYSAGPLMNILFALFLFVPFFMLPYTTYDDPATIIVTSDYPLVYGSQENAAEEGGLRSGDTIISIDGMDIERFQDISSVMREYSGERELSVTFVRNGERMSRTVTPFQRDGRYLLGVASAIQPTVSRVQEMSPEAMASLAQGDTIISINGEPVSNTADVYAHYLAQTTRLVMEVHRENGQIDTLSFTPYRTSEGLVSPQLTFARDTIRVRGSSLLSAIPQAIDETGRMIRETGRLFGDLFTGKMDAGSSLAGPLRISYVIGETFANGLRSFLQLMAMVSISLGIANLLPLPALDGGSILLSVIEWVRGRRLPVSIYMKYQSVGFFILSALILFVLFSDARFFLS